ncbi:hypothetical protein OR214_01921 [Ralstonia pickettii OR214]|jgi:hypothetical protein|uniref:Uncharacterized protein n=1 Tax=Ralstonia pickettii OR214 TaxID=1264675 RepID=R0DYK0_RALPI|nr:hypothetical protein OR214_01921 [Ralstonia pickettii OR214]OYU22537.1 MAG: hypothetical protein CFE42_11550 [Ralstonia sp. PBBBR1]
MPPAEKVVTRSPRRRVGLIACPWLLTTPISPDKKVVVEASATSAPRYYFGMHAAIFPKG